MDENHTKENRLQKNQTKIHQSSEIYMDSSK